MDDQQLLHYSRHILLDEIGIEGQERLLASKALIIGLGGLGSPVSMYLASSGIGQLTLCDFDTVDYTNLQRQIVHRIETVGQSKVNSAITTLRSINPEPNYVGISARLDATQLQQLVKEHDVVIDCCDNFDTRYAVNTACQQHQKPLVSGAAIQFDGQISVFDFREPNAPCYNCLFPADSTAAELRCATTGIFAPLVGIVGSMQANETVKLLAGINTGLSARLLTINALDMRVHSSKLAQDPTCNICGIAQSS